MANLKVVWDYSCAKYFNYSMNLCHNSNYLMTHFSITLLMQKCNLGFKLIAAAILFESCILDLRMFTQILSTSALMNLTFIGKPHLLKRNSSYVLGRNWIIIFKCFLESSKSKFWRGFESFEKKSEIFWYFKLG